MKNAFKTVLAAAVLSTGFAATSAFAQTSAPLMMVNEYNATQASRDAVTNDMTVLGVTFTHPEELTIKNLFAIEQIIRSDGSNELKRTQIQDIVNAQADVK